MSSDNQLSTDNQTANPYATPQADLTVEPTVAKDKQRVLAAARGQKNANLLILFSFFMLATVGIQQSSAVLVTSLFRLAYIVIMAVVVYRTVTQLHGTVRAVIYALLSWIPLVNLLLLLSISSTATKLLRQNGFKVGLLGANIGEVEKWARV